MIKICLAILREVVIFLKYFIGLIPGFSGRSLRYLIFKIFFRKIGRKVNFFENVSISNFSNIIIGNNNSFLPNSIIRANDGVIELGSNCSFNSNLFLSADFKSKIKIGDNVMVGLNCVIVASNHQYKISNIPFREQGHNSGSIYIGNNVWIGSNSSILKNTYISDNTVIAANSVVNKKFPSNVLIGGNPAKVLKKL